MYGSVGDAAIDKLANAMAQVLGFDTNNGGEERFNSMVNACDYLDSLASVIGTANSNLGSSWSVAADNCLKIENKIATIMSEISVALKKYYDTTHSLEAELNNATKTFNESMDNLSSELDQLGI